MLSRIGTVVAAMLAALAKFSSSNVVTASNEYVPTVTKYKHKAKDGQIRRHQTKKQKIPKQTVRRK